MQTHAHTPWGLRSVRGRRYIPLKISRVLARAAFCLLCMPHQPKSEIELLKSTRVRRAKTRTRACTFYKNISMRDVRRWTTRAAFNQAARNVCIEKETHRRARHSFSEIFCNAYVCVCVFGVRTRLINVPFRMCTKANARAENTHDKKNDTHTDEPSAHGLLITRVCVRGFSILLTTSVHTV